MPVPVPLGQQRIPPDVSRRLDRLRAAAREAIIETHANLACDMVAVLADRLPFDEALGRYMEVMDLYGDDGELVGNRAMAILAERDTWGAERGARRFEWRWATPRGAYNALRRRLTRGAEEALLLELAAARAEERLIRTHLRYARRCVDLLELYLDASRAVLLYVERLEIPDPRARSVYQRAMARLAESRLPGLEPERG